MIRVNCKLMFSFALFTAVVCSHALGSEIHDRIRPKYKSKTASMKDVSELNTQAWESYRMQDYEEADRLLNLSWLIEEEITGKSSVARDYLNKLTLTRQILTEMRMLAAARRSKERRFRENDEMVSFTLAQIKSRGARDFDRFTSADEFLWLESAASVYLHSQSRDIPAIMLAEGRQVCGLAIDRYATLPAAQRNRQYTPEQFRSMLCQF